jgi:hypothetical protein
VVKAKGVDVWSKFFPGATIGPDTDMVKSHDLIVVRSTTDVPQDSRHVAPGSTPLHIVAVTLVIDSTNGFVIEVTTATAADPFADDNSVFGPVSDVPLANVDRPTHAQVPIGSVS